MKPKQIPLLTITENQDNPNTSFPCDSCGLCCKALAGNELLSSLDRGDGTCTYFNEEEHNCSIYESRPTVCKVEEIYPLFSHKLSKIEYFNMTIKICNYLKEQEN